jgi:hypothetical protein
VGRRLFGGDGFINRNIGPFVNLLNIDLQNAALTVSFLVARLS